MFLTSEQKEIGKENFLAAVGSEHVDREILKAVTHESLTPKNGLGARYFGYEPIEKPVRVAVLGTGDEGNVLIGALNPKYHDCVAIADVRPYSQYRAFHGDVYSETANSVRPGLMKIYDWKTEEEARQHVKVYADYKELFDAEGENIEAVIIALPLHLHAPAAIEAMKRGYHVLTEKLMGHSVANCKEMGRAAVKYKKHLATGHQRHYNVLYKHANTLINKDVLGEIHYIRAQWHRNNKPFPDNDSWRMPMPKNFKPDDPQASDIEKELKNWQNARKKAADAKRADEVKLWDLKIAQKEAQLADSLLGEQNGGEYKGLKLKNVKEYGYQDDTVRDDMRKTEYARTAGEELIRWRIWDRTGGGMMAELGSHQMDAASIFLTAQKLKRDPNFEGEVHPLSVVASGVRNLFPLDRDADDHVHCLYEYPAEGYDPSSELGRQKKITVAYSSINGNDFDGYGETVFGSKGTLVIEKEKDAYLYRTAGVNEKTKVAKGAREELDVVNVPEGDKLSAAIGTQGLWGDISRGYSEELEHWAWCIRKNPNCEDPKVHPKCYPPVALGDAIIALATNIAIQLEQPIEFQPEWFDIANDATPDNDYREVLGKKADDPDLKPDLKKYGITD
ncbi:MAG: Gfo/Idh/MocA family oxidoreductase [Planctomycetaceae bacterium]|jgi:predicted dehydrogenase|nr:Gfo/Idh/MocA family oxidoreductase [Planctomycetaceae bacterium]